MEIARIIIWIDRKGGVILIKNIESVEFYTAGSCNLKCSYCYLSVLKNANEINMEVIQALKNGDFIKNAKSFIAEPERVVDVGLWGGEPTLNSKYIYTFLEDLFEFFPNIETISFSTNATMSKNLIEMVNQIYKFIVYYKTVKPDHGINLQLQISLDGEKYINDKSRGIGATDKILQSVNCLKEQIKSYNGYPNFKLLNISFKPTISIDSMKDMLNTIDGTLNWFKFFDNIVTDLKNHTKDYKNIHASVPFPTLVTPGDFTSEDGKILNTWLTEIYTIDPKIEGLKLYEQPMYNRGFDRFDVITSTDRLIKPEYTCGGGGGSLAFNHRGELFACHRMCQLEYTDLSPTEKLAVESGMLENSRTELNDLKYHYVHNAYHSFAEFNLTTLESTVKMLALSGQADPIYLKDDNACTRLWVALQQVWCHIGFMEKTGSMFLPHIGEIRLLANGASESMWRAYYKTKKESSI